MNIVRFAVAAVAVLCLGGMTGGGAPATVAGPGSATAVERSTDDQDLRGRARLAEREYRHRLARLRRLREIAVQHNRLERVAELDGLYEQLRTSHVRCVDEIRKHMGVGARKSLDKELDEGRDPREWVREHRDKAHQLLAETRRRRAEVREHHQETRERTQERRHDLRQHRRERHQDVREHRQDEGRDTLSRRREIRHSAREAAQGQWAEARVRAGAESGSRQAAQAVRQRAVQDRAREHRDERLVRAARRHGILRDGRRSHRSYVDFRVPSQREADAEAGAGITVENADAALEELRRDIVDIE